jgi:hypothetical protein
MYGPFCPLLESRDGRVGGGPNSVIYDFSHHGLGPGSVNRAVLGPLLSGSRADLLVGEFSRSAGVTEPLVLRSRRHLRRRRVVRSEILASREISGQGESVLQEPRSSAAIHCLAFRVRSDALK